MNQRTYICIDLKTFYASVECAERGLDPFTTNLVVADTSRGEKTICLAISPAMKAIGIPNRCRLFQIPECVEYIAAPPRMKLYMQRSADIYSIYLRYISPDDIHVYSIDECFIDATPYLSLYQTDAFGLARMLMGAVLDDTGITATAGIGTNLFLAKVALDITAKHEPDGIGYLDDESFREKIWHHKPITDVWNVGPGIAVRLRKYGVEDLAGVAAMDKDVLFREFGVNAEFLIDHANGYEPCTMEQIKAYRPESSGLGNGQVLSQDYSKEEGRIVLREMVDALVLELVEKNLVASGIHLIVGYARTAEERERLKEEETFEFGHGKRTANKWKSIPHSNGQRKLPGRTGSFRKIWPEFEKLYDELVDESRIIRRFNIGITGLMPEEYEETTLFEDVTANEKERSRQKAILDIKGKFGKNALLKASSLQEKATARDRNRQVGGHRA